MAKSKSSSSTMQMQMESFTPDTGKNCDEQGQMSTASKLYQETRRRNARNKIKGLLMLLHIKLVCAGLFAVFNLYWIAYNYSIAQHEAIGGFVFVLCSILYFWCLCWLEYGVHELSTTDYTQRSFLTVTVMLLAAWFFAAASLILTCAVGVTYSQASDYLELILRKKNATESLVDDPSVEELELLMDDPSSFQGVASSRTYILVTKYTGIVFLFFPLITVVMIQSMIYTFQKTDYFIYKIAKQDCKLAAKVASRKNKIENL